MATDQHPESGAGAGDPEETPRGPLFIDANVFLRYLTNDVPEQADRVEALLRRAARGEAHLATSVLVVAEVVWVLTSFYKRPKEAVRAAVLALCHTPGLDVEEADALVQAAEWHAEKNVDFADAYHAAWMHARDLTEACTFNLRHFRRFDHLEAWEPA